MGRRATRIEAGRRYAVVSSLGPRDEAVALSADHGFFKIDRWHVSSDAIVVGTARWVEEVEDFPTDAMSLGIRGLNAVLAAVAALCAVSAGTQLAWAWELLFIVFFVLNTIGALL